MATVRIEKPRAFQGTKDIVLTLLVLLVVTFLTVGFTGLCSVNPGKPAAKGPVQRVDEATFLKMEARGVNYPVRDPKMPENWIPNSARRVQTGGETGTLVGWVIDGENYISLTQTSAPLKKAEHPDDKAREEVGTEKVGGQEWKVLKGDEARTLWVADMHDVRLILEGMAPDDQIRTAAEKVTQAQPIDTKKPITG